MKAGVVPATPQKYTNYLKASCKCFLNIKVRLVQHRHCNNLNKTKGGILKKIFKTEINQLLGDELCKILLLFKKLRKLTTYEGIVGYAFFSFTLYSQ